MTETAQNVPNAAVDELHMPTRRRRGCSFATGCTECNPLWEDYGPSGWLISCHGCGMDMPVVWSGWVGTDVFVAQYGAAGDHHPACRGGESNAPHGQGCDADDIYTFVGYQPTGHQWVSDAPATPDRGVTEGGQQPGSALTTEARIRERIKVMSDSQAWNNQLSKLKSGNHGNAHELAENLLELLNIDDGRHVPDVLIADLEATAYRLAALPADGGRSLGEERLTNAIVSYEMRKWSTRLTR